MKKFIKTIIIFFIFPLCILAVLAAFYLKRDIYSDFGYHHNYSWKYTYQSLGDISTKKLLQSKTEYNSFVFGSSRVTGLYACYLQMKIKNSLFFHYANWSETIGGIYAKINLLDSLQYELKNIIIYLDTDYTFLDQGICNSNDHYLLTHQNKGVYYLNHFKSFIPPLLNYDKVRLLLGYRVMDISPNWESDITTNDCNHQCSVKVVAEYGNCNFDAHYRSKIDSLKRIGFLYKRPHKQGFKENQISTEEHEMLKKIKEILKRKKSKYYVIISPLYDQMKFSNKDMQILNSIFGEHLYDQSGINKITNNEYNYADRKHFLPCISKDIIDSIIQ